MEDLFQSDIIDVTQYLDRIENDQNYTVKESRSATDIILKSINSTLDYYKRSQEAYNACHNILFRAWYRRQDAGVSFSVSRYSRGIKAEEYYQIIQQLDMTEHFKLALLALTPKNAILALQEILPSVQFSHYHIYLPFYIKTMHCLSTEETFIKAADYLYPFISNDKLDVSTLQQLLSIILTTFKSNENLTEYCCIGYYQILCHLYRSSLSIFTNNYQSTIHYLFNLIHKKYQNVLKMNNNIQMIELFDLKASSNTAKIVSTKSHLHDNLNLDIVAIWHHNQSSVSLKKRHQLAFLLIFQEIQRNATPSRTIDYLIDHHLHYMDTDTINTWIQSCHILLSAFRSLKPSLTQDHDQYIISCMENCLSSLLSVSGSYETILKAMIQYLDIWIFLLKTDETLYAFSQLIFISKQWDILYVSIKKAINVFNKFGSNNISYDDIKVLSSLLKVTMDYMDINDLLHFRDTLFIDSNHRTDHVAIPPVLNLWDDDDEAELRKCCNQFVRNDNDQTLEIDPKLLQQVVKLSALWPFEVLHRLVLLSLGNKGQYTVVVPILQQLGDLCMYRQHSNDKSLLARVILYILDEYPNQHESFVPFLNASCFGKIKFNTSLFLESKEYFLSTSNLILLQPWELINDCLIPRLRMGLLSPDNINERSTTSETLQDQGLPKIKSALRILQSLTNDHSTSASLWKQQLQSQHYPILLTMDIYSLLHNLTLIMDKRYHSDFHRSLISSSSSSSSSNNSVFLGSVSSSCLDILDITNACDIGRKLIMTLKEYFGRSQVDPFSLLSTTIDSIKQFYETSFNYDWRSRLFWYEMFTIVYQENHLPLYLPSKIIDLLNGFMPNLTSNYIWDSIPNETNDDTIETGNWGLLLNGCRASIKLSDELFKYSEIRIPNIWQHPNDEDSFLQSCLIQNLHPYVTVATHFEYQSLLIHFLGKLYDTMNGDELMRYYDYSPKLARFIRLLTAEDCKKLFILSHSMNLLKKHQLLKKPLSTTITTKSQIDGEIFFVSGIVQVVQSIKTWQNASCEGISTTRQAIRTTTIRSVINDPALNANNCIDLPNLDDVDEVNDETAKVNKIKDCYYPWYDTTILSSRALSLILLKIICQASNTIGMEAYKSLRVLLLQVVEGLSDRYTRNLFLVQKSNTTKRALAKWKRDIKMNRVRLHLRPILTNEEMDWVINALQDLTYEEDCEAILNSFATPTSNNTPLYTYY